MTANNQYKEGIVKIEKEPIIDPYGFREYDARWFYPKNINLHGCYIVGKSIAHQLKEKYKRFNSPKDRNIFDLDKEDSVLDNPLLLLRYDNNYKVSKDKMMHSHDNILNMEGTASWPSANMNWRMRLRKLCRYLDIQFPSARTR